MKTLLTVEAVVEGGTALALVAVPSLVAELLLGSPLDAPGALVVARVAGVTLLSLAFACWHARGDGRSAAARGLVAAMALYNAAVIVALVHAAIGPGLTGIALWPAVLAHAVMAGWCVRSAGPWSAAATG